MSVFNVVQGDCTQLLPLWVKDGLVVDACICDPPYELTSIVKRFGGDNAAPAKFGTDGAFARASAGFMGMRWDGTGVAEKPETWRAVYDVLKPGAHLLAFGGTRTYHRMTCAIEDAGFEIRDCLFWTYGTGFPKSHDAAQSIEKLLTTGKARRPDRDLGGLSRNRFSGSEEGTLISDTGGKVELTTAEALRWEGWGTALKPAVEPIVVARKPLIGTVAENILRYGTGAINVDTCRVEGDETITTHSRGQNTAWAAHVGMKSVEASGRKTRQDLVSPNPHEGRWPANLIHDGSDDVVACFPNTPGQLARLRTDSGAHGNKIYGALNHTVSNPEPRKDTGSAARFFNVCPFSEDERRLLYYPKANKTDRAGSSHPTVKPIALMRHLCRLVVPPGGLVLDPFAGSGTTLEAAYLEGFDSVGIEQEPQYVTDIHQRMSKYRKNAA